MFESSWPTADAINVAITNAVGNGWESDSGNMNAQGWNEEDLKALFKGMGCPISAKLTPPSTTEETTGCVVGIDPALAWHKGWEPKL